MRDALHLITYTVMVPIWLICWTIDGIALLIFGKNVLPESDIMRPVNELLASILGQRMADAVAGVVLLAAAYYLFMRVRDALNARKASKSV